MYPTTCVPTSQCALTSSLSSAHAGVETAARPSVQGHCAHLSLSLSLARSLARKLARSYLTIATATAIPPPRPWPRFSGNGRPWHARRRAFTRRACPRRLQRVPPSDKQLEFVKKLALEAQIDPPDHACASKAGASHTPCTTPCTRHAPCHAHAVHTLHTHALDLQSSQRC